MKRLALLPLLLLATSCTRAVEPAPGDIVDPVPEPAPDAALAAALAPAEPAAPADPSAVVARIGGKPAVTEGEVHELVSRIVSAQRGRIPPERIPDAVKRLRHDVIEQIVTEKVLLAEAAKAGIEVSEAEITNALAQITGGLSDPAAVAARAGVPVEVVRDDIRKRAIFDKLLSSATNGLPAISDADVRAAFDDIRAKNPSAFPDRPETVTASHILVEARKGVATPEQDAAALEKIKGLRERALAGEDFAELARENSDCPSKSRGGNLGAFPRGQMVKEFDEAAFAQPVGEIGEIVKTQFGYHIIKVTAHEEGKPVAFEDIAPRLRHEMERDAVGKAISARVKEFRDAAGIEILSATVVSDAVAIPPAPAKEEAAPAKEEAAPAKEEAAPAAE